MSSTEFTLGDVLRGVFSRKLLAAAVFVATLAAVVVATLMCPKSYTSNSKLFVRLGRENLVLDPTATLGENAGIAGTPLSRDAEINSIVEMVTSKQLLAEVVERVGAVRILKRQASVGDGSDAGSDTGSDATVTPSMLNGVVDRTMGFLTDVGVVNDLPIEERAVIKLQKRLEVQAVEKSNVILLSYETHSPEVAKEVVAVILDLYLTEHTRINRSEGAFPFLSEQTDAVSQDLEQAENALRKLKNETGILDVLQDRQVLLQRMARLKDELMMTETQQVSLAAEVDNLETKLASLPDSKVIESKTGAGNEGADGMRQQFFELEMQWEAATASLTMDHPRMKILKEQLHAVSELVKNEEADRTERVTGPNTVYDKTHSELILKQALLVSLNSRVEAYRQQIKDTTILTAEFTTNEVRYAQLNRQIAVNDGSYRKSAQSLLQAKIDDNLKKQQISNITVAQGATLNLRPSFPNKLVNLVLGMLCGLLNALGLTTLLEYRNPMLRASMLSDEFADLPLFAVLPVKGSKSTLVGA